MSNYNEKSVEYVEKSQNMKYCDLHCHSTCSDGTFTPAELIDLACEAGLSALALTDHNTVDGIQEFIEAAKGKIEACGGCEFTTEDNGQELHLLGLFLDTADLSDIKNAMQEQQERKANNNRETIERLAEAGYDLSYDEFISEFGDGVKNRNHIAKYMLKKGIVKDKQEAFDGLLSPENGFYREGKKLDFYEMIKRIEKAGGLSVWAHPLFNVDKIECERIIEKAKATGLNGVEVFYSTYSDDDTQFMVEMSEKYELLQSGGSDFHGTNKLDISLGSGRGNLKIPYELYLKMKEYSGKA